MFDDFFVRALLAGIGVAIVAGPLGCVVVWRRLSYFGDTLSHGALLGVALGLAIGVDLVAGVFFAALAIALCVHALGRGTSLPSDAILGILSHSTLAAGIVLLSTFETVRVDLLGLLFGDILAVSRRDLVLIYLAVPILLAVLALVWRPLLAATVNAEIARAEGAASNTAEIALLVLIAGMIALAMQIVGVLLISALLIIPASAARGFAGSPETMAAIAATIGVLSVAAGLGGSMTFDTPAGPTIVCAAALFFVAELCVRSLRNNARR